MIYMKKVFLNSSIIVVLAKGFLLKVLSTFFDYPKDHISSMLYWIHVLIYSDGLGYNYTPFLQMTFDKVNKFDMKYIWNKIIKKLWLCYDIIYIILLYVRLKKLKIYSIATIKA